MNWIEELMTYDFTIYHRPGIDMILPDALSRLFSNHQSLEEGNELANNNVANLINIAAVTMERITRCVTCKQRTAKACETGFCKVHCLGCRIPPKVNQEPTSSLSEPILLDDNNPQRVQSWMKEFITNVIHKKEPDDDQHAMLLLRKEHYNSHAGAEQMFISLFRKGWYWSDSRNNAHSSPIVV